MGLEAALSGPGGCRFLSVVLKSNKASLKSQKSPLVVMQTVKTTHLSAAVSIWMMF